MLHWVVQQRLISFVFGFSSAISHLVTPDASRATGDCQSHDSRNRNCPFLHFTTLAIPTSGCAHCDATAHLQASWSKKELKLAARLSVFHAIVWPTKAPASASSVIFNVLEQVTIVFKKSMFAGGKSIYYEVRILIACELRMHLIDLNRCSICKAS